MKVIYNKFNIQIYLISVGMLYHYFLLSYTKNSEIIQNKLYRNVHNRDPHKTYPYVY